MADSGFSNGFSSGFGGVVIGNQRSILVQRYPLHPDVLDWAKRCTGTLPDKWLYEVNRLICRLDAAGVWSKFDVFNVVTNSLANSLPNIVGDAWNSTSSNMSYGSSLPALTCGASGAGFIDLGTYEIGDGNATFDSMGMFVGVPDVSGLVKPVTTAVSLIGYYSNVATEENYFLGWGTSSTMSWGRAADNQTDWFPTGTTSRVAGMHALQSNAEDYNIWIQGVSGTPTYTNTRTAASESGGSGQIRVGLATGLTSANGPDGCTFDCWGVTTAMTSDEWNTLFDEINDFRSRT